MNKTARVAIHAGATGVTVSTFPCVPAEDGKTQPDPNAEWNELGTVPPNEERHFEVTVEADFLIQVRNNPPVVKSDMGEGSFHGSTLGGDQ